MTAWNDPNQALEAQKYENPIPSRLLILQTVDARLNKHLPTAIDDLARHFNFLDDGDKLFALNNRLKAMLRDGQLERGDGIHYTIAPAPTILEGKISINPKGFGFLLLEDMPDLFVHEKQLRTVFDGDVVHAVATEFRGKAEARVLDVIHRHTHDFVGKLLCDDEGYFIALSGKNAHQIITIHPDDVERMGAKVDDDVKISLVDYPTNENYATGKIIQVLSAHNARQLIITTTLVNHNISDEFSTDALAQANKFSAPTTKDYKNRQDLRHLALVTIDGEDSRDFDDAVFAQKRAGGNFRVVVAIADVSHYVTPCSPLDVDAYERGTSVYFPHHVVPMLPAVLSNDLCSLNPNVDRLCMVADINLSRKGNVTAYSFYPAVMHSHARLTYNQVNDYFAAIGADENHTPKKLPKQLPKHLPQTLGDAAIAKSLSTLHQLYVILDKKRSDRGAMAFETPESYIKFKEDGDIISITTRERGISHKLIEECMLLANTCAANFALKHKLPVLYRNHEKPSDEKALRLHDYIKNFGLSFPQENPNHSDYAHIINATKDRPDAITIHSMLLRSMMQANYSPDNIGHFGLAYDEYAHFTSPIRRYPDLMLHRAIKDFVLKQKPKKTLYQTLDEAGAQTSQTERRAEEASREVEAWLKCHYMQRHIGDEFLATITSVTSFGLFASLNDLLVEGLIHIKNLDDDYYRYDEKAQALVGDKGKRFVLGQQVRVSVAAVNMDLLQIDFELIKTRKKRRTH